MAVNGTAKAQSVTLGISDEVDTEVISGLNPGDQVIIGGNLGLEHGDKIVIKGPLQKQINEQLRKG